MYDTMLMAKRVDPTKSASLEACVSRFLPQYAGYKIRTASDIKEAWRVPTRDLLERNAMDALVTKLLFDKLYQILKDRGVPDEVLHEDCRLAMVAQRIQDRGFFADMDRMLALKDQQVKLSESHLARLRELSGDVTLNPNSSTQVVKILKQRLGIAEDVKMSSDWATLRFIELSKPGTQEAEFCKLVIEYRSAEKLIGTYIHGYAPFIGSDGFIHADLRWPGTVTWRFSSSDPNIQNIPREGIVRSIFTAPPGMFMWEADYSQFELRAAAALSKDPVLRAGYLKGVDLHADMARRIGFPMPTKEQRAVGKVINFGTGYGAGAAKLREQLMEGGLLVDLATADRYKNAYWQAYAVLNKWREEVMQSAGSGQRIKGPVGHYSWTLEDFLVATPNDVEGCKRSIYNAPIQSPSTRYCLLAAERLESSGIYASLTVHDSLMGYAPLGTDPLELKQTIVGTMVAVAQKDAWWDGVPVQADFKCGSSWNEMADPKGKE